MTYTVDPEALRAVARRLDAEDGEIRTRAAAVTDPDAGAMSALVHLALADLGARARHTSMRVADSADSLRVAARLAEAVDRSVADRLHPPPVLPAPSSLPTPSSRRGVFAEPEFRSTP